MLSKESLEAVLDQFVQDFIPAMQRWRYHLILAKGGIDYPHLSEQSMLGHVVNGVFALARLLRFVIEKKILVVGLDEQTLRKAFALIPVHDAHKLGGFEPMGKSEFSIPLERLQEEYTKLGLNRFADVDAHLMRAANVSKRSSYQGDLVLSEDRGSLLWLLVRLADTMASMADLRQLGTLEGYLKQFAPEFASKGGRFRLYTHEVRDVRGVLTNLVHSIVAQRLEVEYGFYPQLFFATGTLYLGPSQLPDFDRPIFIHEVVEGVMGGMISQAGAEAKMFVQEGGIRRKERDFQPYVHTFADPTLLLEIPYEEVLKKKPEIAKDRETRLWRFGKEELDGIGELKEKATARKRKKSQQEEDDTADGTEGWWRAGAEKGLGVSLSEPEEFNGLWWQAYEYLLYVDNILRALNSTQDPLEWFISQFGIQKDVAEFLRSDKAIWRSGGLGKYVLVIAYHFLKGTDFAERAAESRPVAEVLNLLHQRTIEAFGRIDLRAGREAATAELGFREELTDYLHEYLSCSWASEAQLQDDVFAGYVHPKRKGHSNEVCSICNRASKWVQEIRTGILGDFGRVFSNRVLPAQEAPGKNRPWCPICHLEFILRQLVGLSLPSGADYGRSYRIYLYILPTFSFTPEHPRLFERILREFRRVSSLSVRDFGQATPGLPRMWLERRELDPDWMADVVEVFARQAEWVAQHGRFGDRLTVGRVAPQPHYYLLTWERLVAERETDDARIPTRSEAWAKAIFAALIISGLTSVKVYVTEHPYLQVFDPAEIKATITLDGAPPILRGIVGDQKDHVSLYGREIGLRSGLEQALDVTSALWTVTAEVRRAEQTTKDKQIAARLSLTNVEPLAGAAFYKEYGRLNDDQSPFPPLTRACEVLLDYFGGEMMDLVKRIAEESLKIRLPFRKYERGKAHSYELVFREAVEAMRKAFAVIPELKISALTGEKPSAQSVAELKKLASGTLLKAMERRQTSERGDGFINPAYKDAERQDLGVLVGNFIDLIVEGVFLSRASGSFAKFLHLEDSLADGVYYVTDRVIGEKWESNQAARAAKVETTTAS